MAERQGDGADPIRSAYSSDPEMAELIELFVSELGERTDKLRDAFANGALEYLRTEAHRLKGAAPGYGFVPIGQAAARLEDLLRDDTDSLERASDAIRVGVDELVDLCGRAVA